MNRIPIFAVVCLCCSLARADDATDTAMANLRAKQAARAAATQAADSRPSVKPAVEVPPDIAAAFDAGDKQFKELLETQRGKVAAAADNLRAAHAIRATDAAMKADAQKKTDAAEREMSEATLTLRQLREDHGRHVPWLSAKPYVGDIGAMRPMKILQILEDRGFLAQPLGSDETFWIQGIDTENMVDGRLITWPGFLKVSGTRNYGNVLGAARTVLLLEPIDLRPFNNGVMPGRVGK
jgi:hypothetical protein